MIQPISFNIRALLTGIAASCHCPSCCARWMAEPIPSPCAFSKHYPPENYVIWAISDRCRNGAVASERGATATMTAPFTSASRTLVNWQAQARIMVRWWRAQRHHLVCLVRSGAAHGMNGKDQAATRFVELGEQKFTERRPNRREWPKATWHPKCVQEA
jgi:hypothetical protein